MKHIQTFESFLNEGKDIAQLSAGDEVTLKADGKKATIVHRMDSYRFPTRYLVKDESGKERVVNLNAIEVDSAIKEHHLPFEIEKTLRLNGISFEIDEERTAEDNDNRLEIVEVYVGNDSRSGSEWIIKTGLGSNFYYLEIQKDEEVVWSSKYPRSQKSHFDQDCMNSLGFLPELG
jgi:hypothetical protein